VLQKYLHVIQKPTTPAKNHEVVKEAESDDDDDVSTLHEACQRKAKTLLLKWKQIPGANIVDLVADFVRWRKKNIPPTGWEPFAILLAKSNIPLALNV